MIKTLVSMLMILLFTIQGMPAQMSRQMHFEGSWQAVENDTVKLPTIYVDGNGEANITGNGAYMVHFDGIVNNNANMVGTAVVIAEFTASDGSALLAEGIGIGKPTDTPGMNYIVEKYTITEGTGRFADAGGTISVDRQINLATGASSGTVKGTITLKHK